MTNNFDKHYMERALKLAELGSGWVAPNPLVGAVIVKDDKIIGEGYHATYGEAHAEVVALKNAVARGEDITGATLYATLEPCNHTGKQPPCTEAILKSGIIHVVYAAADPNPDVAGGGATKLRSAGLTVEGGILETEARYQNRIYFHWIAHHKPYVMVKVAVSKNNKLTARAGTRTDISGPEAWEFVQSLRHRCDAIMVGSGTITVDNPELTVRSTKIPRPRNPLRIIIDGQLTVPPTAKIFQNHHNLIITSGTAPANRIIPLQNKAVVTVIAELEKNIAIKKILAELANRDITSVLVEGGAHLLQLFFESGLVNEWVIVRSPNIFTEGVNFILEPHRLTEKFVRNKIDTIGTDVIETYSPR